VPQRAASRYSTAWRRQRKECDALSGQPVPYHLYAQGAPQRPATGSCRLGARLDEIHERAQRRRHEAPARIVEERPGEALPPLLENRDEAPRAQLGREEILEGVDHAEPGAGGGY